ncbi:MAG: DUF2460 domain-containing protein [Candidatus Solibacter usitatus]|nr:DUF2460 domain-containing protein [Candidatus Solibacter usitatus]
MADFPTLKTGAPSQYPMHSSREYRTEVVSFLDGTEQRFRLQNTAARKWGVPLRELDEREARNFRMHFEQQRGRQGSFTLVDPETGVVEVAEFDGDAFTMAHEDDDKAGVYLVIRKR